ncbi:MAG TPA: proton-conducting transporter membrane subunit [Candidatus Saccharimonadales bacterium]|nr:proton-conducting transporter membrane subunit [Candidatus Saccharimonadales bacterium]
MEIIVIIASLLAASLAGVAFKRKIIIESASVLAALVAFVAAAKIALRVADSGVYSPYAFFSVDALGAIAMLIVATVGLAAACYSVAYLRREVAKGIIGLTRVRQYYVLLALFLAAMQVAVAASSPLFTWVFIEATTLCTAFLISFYNKSSAMEAAWKYLMINSIGLLLALFGTLLFSAGGSSEGFLTWNALMDGAKQLDPAIVQMAFIFVLVGYGTKVGLAPMHTWLPDAHSKAPSPISALLSGVLLNVALVAILRFAAVANNAVGQSFTQHLLIAFGAISVLLAAIAILTQKNYKRLLAYSSIENMGLIVIGVGFGGVGAFAAILHMIYHSLLKSSLFFMAGNFLLKYGSAYIAKVRGSLRVIPATTVLFLLALFAVAGFPPFGIFFTEFFTLSAGLKSYAVIVVLVLAALAIAFIGFFRNANAMALTAKPTDVKSGEVNKWLVLPPLVLVVLALVLTFYMPAFLQTLIDQASARYQ